MNRGEPTRWQQIGADGAWTLCLSCLLIGATLGLSWLAMMLYVVFLAALSKANVSARDWIVVLGKRLLGSAVTREYATRLRRAELLYRDNPGARIMLLGGHTSEGPFTEAQQGRHFLLQRGIPAEVIQVEEQSLHTLENLQNVRQLVQSSVEQPIVLISSRYHLARSHILADGMGLQHRLCAAEDSLSWSPALLRRLLVESFYLHWYWVGRIWSTLLRNQKSLERIS